MSTPRMAQGKRLLMEAAARLAARQSGARALPLRELAREAGLNHNTFYRHFASQDELIHAIVDDFGQQLREGLAKTRLEVTSLDSLSTSVVGWTLDFALAHQDVFVVAMRERYGPSGPVRDAVQAMLTILQDDMLRELQARGALPALPEAVLRPLLGIIIDHTFKLCFEHIEAPQDRARRLVDAQRLFETLMLGAVARQSRPS